MDSPSQYRFAKTVDTRDLHEHNARLKHCRATEAANEAFREKDYAEVVRHLESVQDMLLPSQFKKLEYARKRLPLSWVGRTAEYLAVFPHNTFSERGIVGSIRRMRFSLLHMFGVITLFALTFAVPLFVLSTVASLLLILLFIALALPNTYLRVAAIGFLSAIGFYEFGLSLESDTFIAHILWAIASGVCGAAMALLAYRIVLLQMELNDLENHRSMD